MSSPSPPEAENIRGFTRAYGLMGDPPWLPIAIWVAVAPLLKYLGYIGSSAVGMSLVLAAVLTAVATQWYRRTYGVVRPSQPRPWVVRPVVGLLVVASVVALEIVSSMVPLPVRLGIAVFGAYLAWGAVASGGYRKHLYVLAAICVLVAFVPLVLGGDFELQGVVIQTAFGLGWCLVCIADLRVVMKGFAAHRAESHGR